MNMRKIHQSLRAADPSGRKTRVGKRREEGRKGERRKEGKGERGEEREEGRRKGLKEDEERREIIRWKRGEERE